MYVRFGYPICRCGRTSGLRCILLAFPVCRRAANGPTRYSERFHRQCTVRIALSIIRFWRPGAAGYAKVTPAPVRTGVTNFVTNPGTPYSSGNDIFQPIARLRERLSYESGHTRRPSRCSIRPPIGLAGTIEISDQHSASGPAHRTTCMLPLLGPSDVLRRLGLSPARFISIEGQITAP